MMVSSKIIKIISGVNVISATGGIVRIIVLSSADINERLYFNAK